MPCARRANSVPDSRACAPEVTLAGGRFADIAMDAAMADGNLVTGPAWPAHPVWLARFVENGVRPGNYFQKRHIYRSNSG